MEKEKSPLVMGFEAREVRYAKILRLLDKLEKNTKSKLVLIAELREAIKKEMM